MKPRFRIPLCALIAAIILTVICPSANATSYFFLQSGYTGGGTITGAFEGTDMNGDGRPTIPVSSVGWLETIIPDFSFRKLSE